MEDLALNIDLPQPFARQKYSIGLGSITWFVGPNGAGKTRFAEALIPHLGGYRLCKLLRADRLAGLEMHRSGYFSSGHFAQGFQKNSFDGLKDQASQFGYGADAIVLLEENRALRAIVEATLSQIFERRVLFEWDSGILQPKVFQRGTGSMYSLHQDECHGLKELVVLLTHLHDTQRQAIIVDEPELNLHPQYQTFMLEQFIQAATVYSKRIILITHSPYMISARTASDLQHIYCFNGGGSPPARFADPQDILPAVTRRCIAQMNAHHRQILFARYVVLVEGVYDRLVLTALLDRAHQSIAAAGGTIIDVSGKEDLPFYLRFCEQLGKEVFVRADLDALFDGSIRRILGKDDQLASALAHAGGGADANEYIGLIQRELHGLYSLIQAAKSSPSETLQPTRECLSAVRPNDTRAESYLAKLVLSGVHGEWPLELQAAANSVRGRLRVILQAFAVGLKIHFWERGDLEDYLVSNFQEKLNYSSSEKHELTMQALKVLYDEGGEPFLTIPGLKVLLEGLGGLPSKAPVDYWLPLGELGLDVVQFIQRLAMSGDLKRKEEVEKVVTERFRNINGVVECTDYKFVGPKTGTGHFEYKGQLKLTFQGEIRFIDFDQDTPAYKIQPQKQKVHLKSPAS